MPAGATARTVPVMMCAESDPRRWDRGRAEALGQLPPMYSLALRLRDAGWSAERLAKRLAVEPEALGPLLDVADAKLVAILSHGPSQCHQPC